MPCFFLQIIVVTLHQKEPLPLKLTIHNMTKVATNILSLNSKDALDFFMKSEQYHGFELPEYFNFDKVLKAVAKTVGNKSYDECLSNVSPEELNDVNLDILLNKDGRYAVRPIILANPYLYYFLVREVCNPKGWQKVRDCFSKFTLPHIASCALPVLPQRAEPFHRSATILNWWNSIEQRSLELSLEYRYMFVTDITNCYGSINPDTIDWALSMKGTEYATDENHNMAQNIIRYVRALQQGRNIGIPQGSSIFDFVGEIILGYSDLLLNNRLQKEGIEEYEILRYRDDYRIFCNDMDKLERISYILQEILESLNFRMNSNKTRISQSVVLDSLKADKLWYIENTPIFNKKGVDFDSFEKHLFYVLIFGRKFPNGGQLKVMLSDLDKRIEEHLIPQEIEEKYIDLESGKTERRTRIYYPKLPGGTIRAMSAVATQIALENVSASHYALRVLSRMVNSLKNDKEKVDIITKVYAKLRNQPNSIYSQLWLQNITYQRDKKQRKCPYDMRLCRLVMGEKVELWNNSWLKPTLTAHLPLASIVDKDTLKKVTPVITFRETRAYEDSIY